MFQRKYNTVELFRKLNPNEKDIILKGFHLFYIDNAENPTKYTLEDCTETIKTHINLYEETRMFTDRELVELTNKYMEVALDEKVWVKKYPEWFI